MKSLNGDEYYLSFTQPEPIPLTPATQEVVNSFATVSNKCSSVVQSPSMVPSLPPPQPPMSSGGGGGGSHSMVIERSGSPPPPPSSASSGFSDDDSLHFDDGRGLSLEEFARHVKTKGKQGLYLEYAEIKAKGTDGTFNNSRCVVNLFI